MKGQGVGIAPATAAAGGHANRVSGPSDRSEGKVTWSRALRGRVRPDLTEGGVNRVLPVDAEDVLVSKEPLTARPVARDRW